MKSSNFLPQPTARVAEWGNAWNVLNPMCFLQFLIRNSAFYMSYKELCFKQFLIRNSNEGSSKKCSF